MPAAAFSRTFLRMLCGPLVWGAHFAFIYGFSGLACARPAWLAGWLGGNLVAWVVGGATLAALAAILALLAKTGLTGKPHDCPAFIRWLTVALGAAAILAIVWQTVPALLLPPCR